jgi:hypothetical protein
MFSKSNLIPQSLTRPHTRKRKKRDPTPYPPVYPVKMMATSRRRSRQESEIDDDDIDDIEIQSASTEKTSPTPEVKTPFSPTYARLTPVVQIRSGKRRRTNLSAATTAVQDVELDEGIEYADDDEADEEEPLDEELNALSTQRQAQIIEENAQERASGV